MSEQIKNWDDLEQLARSENPHVRVSAVIKARARAGKLIDGTHWTDRSLLTAAKVRDDVAHDDERDPTVEEAVMVVRQFFEAWKEKQMPSEEEEEDDDKLIVEPPKLDDRPIVAEEIIKIHFPSTGKWRKIIELAKSQKANERRESIHHAVTELITTMRNLYVLYPDEIGNPDDDFAQSLNNLCTLCNIEHLIVLGGSDKAFVLYARLARQNYVPAQEETVCAITRFYELCKIFRDFAAKRRVTKSESIATFTGADKADELEKPAKRHRRRGFGPDASRYLD